MTKSDDGELLFGVAGLESFVVSIGGRAGISASIVSVACEFVRILTDCMRRQSIRCAVALIGLIMWIITPLDCACDVIPVPRS